MDHVALTRNELEALTTLVWVAIAAALGWTVHRIVATILVRWSRRNENPYLGAVVRRTERPGGFVLPLLCILAVLPTLVMPEAWRQAIEHAAWILTIVAVGWAMMAVIRLYGDIVVARHRVDVEDNLAARQLGTRVDILARVAVTVVVLVVIGSILMTFPPIRALGTTLLASAGVAGIAIGIAARPLFENLVAGVQLALTQPIRLDDVVIVETQYGRVEEIHATYVVLRLWDLRRMVVPLTYFINTPFENWTRRTANLIGEVHLYLDWSFDVAAFRSALPDLMKQQPLWDGQVQNVQVNGATAAGIDVRVLVSARNSGELSDLRAAVREAMICWVREHQPTAFPLRRQMTLAADGSPAAAPGETYAPTEAGPADIPKVGEDDAADG